MVKPRVTFL